MSETSIKNRLEILGLKATWVYLILLLGGVPVAAYFDWIEISPLSLNELGDFLAGAFGPLALFWLVLGFFQQSRELQNSVDALNLQATELRASVEQQAELVAVTRETLAHEKEMMGMQEQRRLDALAPKFQVSFSAGSNSGNQQYKFRLKVLNSGFAVTDVSLLLGFGSDEVHGFRADVLNRGQSFEQTSIDLATEGFPTSPMRLTINCIDQDGSVRVSNFDLIPPNLEETNWSSPFRIEVLDD